MCVIYRPALTDGFHFPDDILSCLHSFPLELVSKLRQPTGDSKTHQSDVYDSSLHERQCDIRDDVSVEDLSATEVSASDEATDKADADCAMVFFLVLLVVLNCYAGKESSSGFLKGGMAYPLALGVWEGLAGDTAQALNKNQHLDFPNCSGKKCPIQKILNSTGKMSGGATCHVEVNYTQYDNSTPKYYSCAQSVDYRLQVSLLQVQCRADSQPRVEFA